MNNPIIKEFRDFLLQGNLLELAVAFIMAAAFGAVVATFTDGIIMAFIAAIFGAARTFMNPASGAMGPMLVPKEELPRAIAWNSLAWQSASILGPFLGGVLVAFSASIAYGTTAVLYALAALALGVGFLGFGIDLARSYTTAAARRLLWASLVYLPLTFIVMAMDKVPKW